MTLRATSVPDDAPHLLLVDDDERIRALLARYLTGQGYRVTTASSAEDAEARLQGITFDLLILDVMMPGRSGFELAREVRARSDVPIMMLTARGDAGDRITGLEAGADDYLAKPFEPRELLLRIAGILRRTAPPSQRSAEEVRFGGFTFAPGRGELRQGEMPVRLTERERELLRILVEARGETVSRLGLAASGGERTVDVQITRLRRKIEADPANPLVLQTVRGIGYRLMLEP